MVTAALCAAAVPAARADDTPGLLRVSPHVVHLGSVPIGEFVPRRFIVTNLSGSPLQLNSFEVFGENGDWRLELTDRCHAGTVLAPGATCLFRVAIHPTEQGRIRGQFCVTGVVDATTFQRRCGRIRGYAPAAAQPVRGSGSAQRS